MPVFDFNNSPQDSKVPECTYKVFYTNCPESSPEHPILILENKAGSLSTIPAGSLPTPSGGRLLSLKERKGLSARTFWKSMPGLSAF